MSRAIGRAYVLLVGESAAHGRNCWQRTFTHRVRSPQAPFVKVNCAAIPGELIESGSCSGTKKAPLPERPRCAAAQFELADGGTLFLDEIGDLSL